MTDRISLTMAPKKIEGIEDKPAPLCPSYRLLVWIILGTGTTVSFISLSSQAAVFTCRHLGTASATATHLPTAIHCNASWEGPAAAWSKTFNETGTLDDREASLLEVNFGNRVKYSKASTARQSSGSSAKRYHALEGCDWSKTAKGWVMAATSLGYYVIQLPMAVLAVYVGSKQVALVATVVCVLTSYLSVPAMGWGPVASAFVCFVRGASAGTLYPALMSLAAAWSGVGETSLMTSFVESGLQVGHAASFIAAALFCDEAQGWTNVFYANAILGAVFAAAFWLTTEETPETRTKCLRLSRREMNFLRDAMSTKGFNNQKAIQQKLPYKSILSSLPVLAIIVAQFGSEWLDCLMVTSLPQFLGVRLGMTEKTTELLTSAGFLLSIPLALVGGWVADWLIEKSVLSTAVVRKLFDVLSKGIPVACCLTLALTTSHNVILLSAIYVINSCSVGLTDSGWPANCFDLAPTLAGLLVSLGEALTAWVWVLTVVLVAYVAPQDTAEQWQTVMYISSGLISACVIFYLVFASGDQQEWASVALISDEEHCPDDEQKLILSETILNDPAPY